MTRTLWVTGDYPPRPGGIESMIAALVAQLDPARTRVLAPRMPDDTAYDALKPWSVVRAGRRPLLPTPTLLRRVREEAVRHRAEVVVFGVTLPLAVLGRFLDLPVLALSHGHEAGFARLGLGGLVAGCAAGAETVGVISAYTARQLRSSTAGRPLVPIRPGVDVRRFRPDVDGSAVRRRVGVTDGTPLVVCVGRLVRRKGQDRLLAAWPSVLESRPEAHLLLVGDGPLRGRLERVARHPALQGRVHLIGHAAEDELPSLYAAADVVVMPSRTRAGGLDVEGLGMVALEAQACGVPVVVGRSGGAPETVVPGRTGLVVDASRPGELAAAIVGLLGDRGRRARMGGRGRIHAERAWSWDAVGTDLRRTLAELAHGR